MARKEIVDEQTAFDVSIICPNLITCTLSSTKSILISIKLQKAVVLYFTKKTKHLSTKQLWFFFIWKMHGSHFEVYMESLPWVPSEFRELIWGFWECDGMVASSSSPARSSMPADWMSVSPFPMLCPSISGSRHPFSTGEETTSKAAQNSVS